MFRNFRYLNDEKKHSLDLKRQGLAPFVESVRVFALAHGVEAANTLERIDALARKDIFDAKDANAWKEAYSLIQAIRMRAHQEMLDRAHGAGYLTRSPLARMKRAAIVSPIGEEQLFFYTDTFDTYLKEHDIDTLIYAGFATDMCILGAEGGARAMLAKGYRCILMRDATVGVETPESFPERLATRYGIHLFEWSLGYSTTFAEFMKALDVCD